MSGVSDDVREGITETIAKFDNERGDIAKHVLLTSDPDYVAGFSRIMKGDGDLLTDGERGALRRAKDLTRAMSGGTDSAGGFAVPAPLDVTLLLTGAGSKSGIQSVARVEVVTSDTWTGVTAAEVSASWDAEAAEVSDDSPTLSGPTVPVYTGRVFVPYSIEVGMDSPNFTANIQNVMVDGYLNLENTAVATGSGSAQPTGIVTALAGGAQVVASATTDVFAIADIYATYDNQSARYIDQSTWVANDLTWTLTRQFGTADGHAFWTRLGGSTPEELIGRPVASSSAMDGVINATVDNNMIVLGDFGNAYVIARRLGFVIESIAHLFATGANRPSGQRGFFGFARTGADSIDDGAFTLLNIT